jgi:dolichyl-phosphate beta-glucosyltransferase
MPTNVCLIIPCYNEAERLDIAQLIALPAHITCVLVNDGSRDETGSLLRRHQSTTLRVVDLPQNVGKGEAIRQGFLQARDRGWLDGAEWVGYWDADMATPLRELEHFFTYAAVSGEAPDGILGSRVYKLGSTIVRSYRRHVLGRLFTTAASALLQLQCYDSQCGAKLFRIQVAGDAFDEPFVSRWIFDVEILARLRGRRLIEYPLREWADVRGSKLSIIKVAGPTLMDLIRIRRRYGRVPSTRA